MSDRKYSLLVLYLTFFLIVFYSFKGLISLSLSFLVGMNIGFFIIPFIFAFTFGFVLLNLVANNLSFPKTTDMVLFIVGFVGLAFAMVREDNVSFYNTFLLFFLPALFSPFKKINDRFFYKMIFSFFVVSTFYLLIENIILHPWRFGLGFEAPTFEQLSAYSNYLISNPNLDQTRNLIDYRHIVGGSNRTGGYLGHVFAMPTLIAMGATFFYVQAREQPTFARAILAFISIFVLINAISTTAIAAFIITILFYELYVKRSFTSIVVLVSIIGSIALLLTFSSAAFYIYNRFLTNMKDPVYVAAFFNHTVLLKPENVPYLIYGNWGWLSIEGRSSHVDLINITVAYGGVIAFMLYKRILTPLANIHNLNNVMGRTLSLVVLTAFICLFHATMTLNINVMMLVTLLMIKSNDICRCPDNHRLIP